MELLYFKEGEIIYHRNEVKRGGRTVFWFSGKRLVESGRFLAQNHPQP